MARGIIRIIDSPIGRVRVAGFVEGCSAMLLFFVAMPLKYAAGRPEWVSVVGSLHGLLWVAYAIVALAAFVGGKLPGKELLLAGAASLIPFGPFVIDGRLKRLDIRGAS